MNDNGRMDELLTDPLLIAMSVIMDRVRKLPEPHRKSLLELVPQTVSDDPLQAEFARFSILETLKQPPAALQRTETETEPAAEETAEEAGFLARRVREAREVAGLSERELAEGAGVSPEYISRVETGDIIPNHFALGKIAKSTRQPVSFFEPPGWNS